MKRREFVSEPDPAPRTGTRSRGRQSAPGVEDKDKGVVSAEDKRVSLVEDVVPAKEFAALKEELQKAKNSLNSAKGLKTKANEAKLLLQTDLDKLRQDLSLEKEARISSEANLTTAQAEATRRSAANADSHKARTHAASLYFTYILACSATCRYNLGCSIHRSPRSSNNWKIPSETTKVRNPLGPPGKSPGCHVNKPLGPPSHRMPVLGVPSRPV